MAIKRLFFGMKAVAPWPALPAGRLLDEEHRHMTLAFLGDADLDEMLERLRDFPAPPFQIGVAGLFDRALFLPHRHPNVAAWNVRFLEQKETFLTFQKSHLKWLHLPDGAFLPHVTLARQPFDAAEWKESFRPLPLYLSDICLYESLGHSKYGVRWKWDIRAPFEAIEHTADIAFIVRGETIPQLYLHAVLALAFLEPAMMEFFEPKEPAGLDEAIMQLNEFVRRADTERGVSFKAVSFHGEISGTKILEWEMIVDV